MIPFNSLEHIHSNIRAEALRALEEVYDSSWYILGSYLKKFENEFSVYTGITYTLGVGNGLDALKLALKALDIGAGDEVIVPANTYIATALAVSELGAKPVFAEPDPTYYTLDANSCEKHITSATKAILPVHLYGQACDMEALTTLSKQYNLPLIEDNAQAVGSTFQNKKTGSFGLVNATSFYPTKNLGALGDAGAVTTDSEELAQKVAMLRNYGSEKKYYNELHGYNSRLDEMQAALLSVKLKKLNEWNLERIHQASVYTKHLSTIAQLVTPAVHPKGIHTFHLYVIQAQQRDKLQQFLSDKGIQTAIHYPIPPYKQKVYEYLGLTYTNYPITEKLASLSLSLPLYPGLSEADQYYIIEQINQFYKNN